MEPNQPNQDQTNTESTDNQNQGPAKSDVAEKAAQQRKRLFDPTGRVEGLTSSETLVADIRRHSFGLFLIYVEIILALTISLGFIFLFLPAIVETFNIDTGTANALAVLFAMIATLFGFVFLVLATRIYKGNQLIVSDMNVTQVLQIGLFDRKVSELSMANIEDVTAHQSGIFPTIFNYGTLKIETAGEQNNFIFIYCPNPNAYAKAILDSRLEFVSKRSSH